MIHGFSAGDLACHKARRGGREQDPVAIVAVGQPQPAFARPADRGHSAPGGGTKTEPSVVGLAEFERRKEIRAASLQFVRKISGFTKPSRANEAAFQAAVDDITHASARLLASLESTAAPKNREDEAAKARARSVQRFGR